MHSLIRRAWVDVDLGALLRNGTAIATRAKACRLLPMVKADAYGLGAVRVARTLERLDPWGFGVATIAEGEELRAGGDQSADRRVHAVARRRLRRARFAPISRRPSATAESIERWQLTGRPWHLAIDTGMSRAGIQWNEIERIRDLLPHRRAAGRIHALSLRRVERCNARRTGADDSPRRSPRSRCGRRCCTPRTAPRSSIAGRRRGTWRDPAFFSTASAAAIRPTSFRIPWSPCARASSTCGRFRDGDTVSYGGTWRATGERRIATLAIGYADGYRRALGNRGVRARARTSRAGGRRGHHGHDDDRRDRRSLCDRRRRDAHRRRRRRPNRRRGRRANGRLEPVRGAHRLCAAGCRAAIWRRAA